MNVRQLVTGKNTVALLDLLKMGKQFAESILFNSAKGSPRSTVFFIGVGFLLLRKVTMLVLEEKATASIINICGDVVHY